MLIISLVISQPTHLTIKNWLNIEYQLKLYSPKYILSSKYISNLTLLSEFTFIDLIALLIF